MSGADAPSRCTAWNRTSQRLHAKRQHGWVSTAIHGDRIRGTGILNNPLYIGQVSWNRSTWKRSAADSKQRRWELNDKSQVVTHTEERLRILSQDLWDRVKARQGAIEGASMKLRTVLKRGRLPTHILSGLLVCQHCGGAFRRTDSRVYGCASHKDGGPAACTNAVRVPWQLAEQKLLDALVREMLSSEGVALVERQVREHMKAQARVPKAPPKAQAAQIAKKAAEIEQLRAMMRPARCRRGSRSQRSRRRRRSCRHWSPSRRRRRSTRPRV